MATKTEPKLTRKQKAFADVLISEPKMSLTRAAAATYGKPDKPLTRTTASVIGAENIVKPSIVHYLQLHTDQAQWKLIDLLKSKQEPIQLRAATEILDRTVGKPQSTQQITAIGSINISFGDGQ